MRLFPFLRRPGASLALVVAALLGLALACVDPEQAGGGATGGTALYAFDTADSATKRLLVWDDANGFFNAEAAPATTRTITSDQFEKVKNLAWGGLAVDGPGNRLWLVGEGGDVVRVERLRQQNGTVPVAEVSHFNLGNSGDRLNNGKFSQAALDPVIGVLYVLETSDTEARVWVVDSPLSQADGSIVSPGNKIGVSGDKGGTGLAAAAGSVYAFFRDGNQIQVSTDTYNGPRLRAGNRGGFNASSVLIGAATGLASYGSLAIDTGNNRLYVARHNQDTSASTPPISVFTFGQFGSNPNQAPDKGTLGTPALNSLRVLAHPGTKDWLGALDSLSGEAPTNVIRLFRNPSQNPTIKSFTLGAGVKLKGLALDGNA